MSRSKKNTASSTTIAAVPNHIMSDILSRLPLNSIFACKRVCKVWRDLTLEPHFAKLHLSRFGTAKPLKMFKDGTLLMMFNKSRNRQGIKITLASYNPQTTVLKKIKHPGTLPWGDSVADVPCFFSPMDALK